MNNTNDVLESLKMEMNTLADMEPALGEFARRIAELEVQLEAARGSA